MRQARAVLADRLMTVRSRSFSLLLVLLVTATAFIVGVQAGADPTLPLIGRLGERFAVQSPQIGDDAAARLIKRDYYKKVNVDKLRDSSIRGMVRSLDDRFSHYFDPKQNQIFMQSTAGQYSGVGMAVQEHKRGLRVTETFDDSPAKAARIKPGDLIIAVDGKSIAGEPSDVSVARIKGKEGTKVKLTVIKKSEGDKREVLALERKSIAVPVAAGKNFKRSGTTLGAVQLTGFVEGAHGQVRAHIDRLVKRGAKGIVFDLRGNGGGRLDEAVRVGSIFIEDGIVVSTDGRSRARVEYKAVGKALDKSLPVVVLVDRGSASASEIVAGALQDSKRAQVVGTRTFGKGVFQEVTELNSGGAISLTVGEYFLPSGRSINKKGVQPDVKASDNVKTDRDEGLEAAFRVLARRAGR